jgi:Sugar (and other) transporter
MFNLIVSLLFCSQIIASRDAITVLGFNKIQKWQSSVDETSGLTRAYVALVVASLIPGYYVVALTSDLIGRKLIQFLGFVLFAIFLSAIAAGRNVLLQPNNNSQYDMSAAGQSSTNMSVYHVIKSNGWIVLFILTFFFASFGPLTTTYIIPAEIFPTRWRGTGYGIAAAFGTLGSITGIFGFLYASQPGSRETQYAYPCDGSASPSDLTADGSCIKLNFCPIGRTVPGGSPVGSSCDVCNLRSMTGCAPFGIGPAGAMGILVTFLIAGAIATLALPLTTQRSLEDINFQNESDAPREFVMFDTYDSELCGASATKHISDEIEMGVPTAQV